MNTLLSTEGTVTTASRLTLLCILALIFHTSGFSCWAQGTNDAWKAHPNLDPDYYYHHKDYLTDDYFTAFPRMLQAAKAGNADAQFAVGSMYMLGQGTPQDIDKGAFWYGLAAGQDHLDSVRNLYWLHYYGVGSYNDDDITKALKRQENQILTFQRNRRLSNAYFTPQNYLTLHDTFEDRSRQQDDGAQVFLHFTRGTTSDNRDWDFPKIGGDYKQMLRAAEGGDPTAEFNLGLMFCKGDRVPQDYYRASLWYERAAKQGHAFAQNNLGWLSAYGMGIPSDELRASEYYALAAEQGHAEGQFNLAIAHMSASGVARDLHRAATLFARAGDQGHGRALCQLGHLYLRGTAVEQDTHRAFKLFLRAVESGDPNLQSLLFTQYLNLTGCKPDALDRLNAEGRFELGLLYCDGRGIEKDYQKAMELLTTAAEFGLPAAQHVLGTLYQEGVVTGQHLPEAYAWLRIAGEQDAKYAEAFSMLMDTIAPEDRNRGEHLYRQRKGSAPARPSPPSSLRALSE